MPYIELKPIKETTEDFERLEKELRELFRREIYAPAMRELGYKPKLLVNSDSSRAILEALNDGRITFNLGKFSGRFSSAISREMRSLGARWDGKQGTWNIPQSALPLEVRTAIAASLSRFEATIARVNRKLSQILPDEFAEKLDSFAHFDATLWKTDQEFRKTLKDISVQPELSEESRKRIAAEWTENMRLWVRDFTEKEITRLREEMKETVYAGNRYGSAVATLQRSYQVSANKAKFLARQETGLLMAKFREVRYSEAGIREYKWACVAGSKYHPVRPAHKKLAELSDAGKIFRYDDPPVTSEPGEPIRRNNPGQDFNCRCFARPVVRF